MAGKQKSLFGVWSGMKPADLNRLLKPFGCKLVAKGRRQDDQVLVTAEPIVGAAENVDRASVLLLEVRCCFDPATLLITDRPRLTQALECAEALCGALPAPALADVVQHP